MKLRAAQRAKKVVVEFRPGETALPPSTVPELSLKRILLPVDFSNTSKKAAQYAAALAKQCSAEVVLLHVVELAPPPPQSFFAESGLFLTRMREDAAQTLTNWRSEFLSGVNAKTALRDSVSAWSDIVTAAAENNADLIVLGTHGRTGMAHLLIGSTAERVVRHAQCPVLVVREKESDFVHATSVRTAASRGKPRAPAKLPIAAKLA